jgi:hypothetical protein
MLTSLVSVKPDLGGKYMRSIILPLLIGAAFYLSGPRVSADSTTSADPINVGPYSTSNWRSADFKGTAYREWDAAGDSFRFVWKTENGDQIGRIGVSYGSDHLGAKIDEIRPDCQMSTDALYTPKKYAWFYWSVYGWTHSSYTYWGNTPHGWNNEFYIIFYTDKTRAAFLADKGCVAKGSVTVDGVVFDCYETPRPVQSQWLAVRRSKTWGGSVNLKKIFDYWRSQGLADEYVVDLGWAMEGFVGSDGTLQLTHISIPNLNLSAFPPASPAKSP